jgi:hypothetical protein
MLFLGAIAQLAIIQHFMSIPTCELTAFAVATMTLSKTVLYGLVELASANKHTEHNSIQDLVLLYIIPNGMWIVMPLAIVLTLSRRIRLLYASRHAIAGDTQVKKTE